MSSTSSSAGGIGFGGMLAILFIGLKLTDHVTWSWSGWGLITALDSCNRNNRCARRSFFGFPET